MSSLSRRAQAVKPSVTLAITARAKALQRAGVDLVQLGAGEPDFDTPAHIKDAAKAALDEGFTKYTATSGIPELKSAIAAKLLRDQAMTYGPDEIIATVGAKFALYTFCQAMLDDGDEVVIPTPAWMSYADMAGLAGGRAVFVPCHAEDNFAIDPARLAAALSPRTRAIVLCSPSNPHGGVLSRENLAAVAEVLRKQNCWIITDDIYEKLIYGGRRFENILSVAPDLKSRTVIVNGVSKAYAMTGWRIGYAAGPRDLIAAMGRIADNATSNPNCIAQRAAVAALDGPQDEVERMRVEFDRRRAFVVERLRQVPGVHCTDPGGAFYAFPDVRAALDMQHRGDRIGSSVRLCEILLTDFGLAIVPGAPFDAEGFVRISFAASMPTLKKGMDRFETALKSFAR